MGKSEELLFEGIDFGDMFTVESEEAIDDTEDTDTEVSKEEQEEESDDEQIFTADLSEEESEEDSESEDDTEDSETSSDESKNSSSSSNYQVFAKALYDEGVITSFDEEAEFESAEDLIKSIQSEIDKQRDDYKNSLPPLVKDIIDNYEDGVDLTQFIKLNKEEQDFSSIDEDDLEDNDKLTRSIIRRDLLESGYAEDEVDDEIDDIFDLNKQNARAKRSLKRINKRIKEQKEAMIETAKAQKIAQQKQYAEQLNAITKNIESTKEIAGVELTKRQQKEALLAMTEVVGKIGDTPVNAITKSRMEDPIEFDKNVSLLWTITKGFKDFTALQKTAKRKAISDLEKSLETTRSKPVTKRKTHAPSGSFYPEETVFSNIKF